MVQFFQARGALPYKESFAQGFARALQESGAGQAFANAFAQAKQRQLQSRELNVRQEESKADRALREREFEAEQAQAAHDTMMEIVEKSNTPGFQAAIQNPIFRKNIDRNLQSTGAIKEGQSIFQSYQPAGTGEPPVWRTSMDQEAIAGLYRRGLEQGVEAGEINLDKAKEELRISRVNAFKGELEATGSLSGMVFMDGERLIAPGTSEHNQRSQAIQKGMWAAPGTPEYQEYRQVLGQTSIRKQSEVERLVQQIQQIAPDYSEEDAKDMAFKMTFLFPKQKAAADIKEVNARIEYMKALSQGSNTTSMNPQLKPADVSRLMKGTSELRTKAAEPFMNMRFKVKSGWFGTDNVANATLQRWMFDPYSADLHEEYEDTFNEPFPIPVDESGDLKAAQAVARLVTEKGNLGVTLVTPQVETRGGSGRKKAADVEREVTMEELTNQIAQSYRFSREAASTEAQYGLISPSARTLIYTVQGLRLTGDGTGTATAADDSDEEINRRVQQGLASDADVYDVGIMGTGRTSLTDINQARGAGIGNVPLFSGGPTSNQLQLLGGMGLTRMGFHPTGAAHIGRSFLDYLGRFNEPAPGSESGGN